MQVEYKTKQRYIPILYAGDMDADIELRRPAIADDTRPPVPAIPRAKPDNLDNDCSRVTDDTGTVSTITSFDVGSGSMNTPEV